MSFDPPSKRGSYTILSSYNKVMRKRNETRFDTITVHLKAIWLWLSVHVFCCKSIVRFRASKCHVDAMHSITVRALNEKESLVLKQMKNLCRVPSSGKTNNPPRYQWLFDCALLIYYLFLNYSLCLVFASTFLASSSRIDENSLISSFFLYFP